MLSKMKTRVKGEKEMKMKKLMVLLLSCSVVFAGSFTNAYAAEVVEEENTQVEQNNSEEIEEETLPEEQESEALPEDQQTVTEKEESEQTVAPEEEQIPTNESENAVDVENTEVKAAEAKGLGLEPDADGFVIEDGILWDYRGSAVSIKIPENVTTIGSYAFNGPYSLKKIEVGRNVVKLQENAFFGSEAEEIILPDTITEIPGHTFSLCNNLKKIVLPESVQTIGEMVFTGTEIERVYIPAATQTIYYNAFENFFGYNDHLTIYCQENSVAHNFAQNNRISYKITSLPSAVKNLKATANGKNNVKLTWSASDRAEGYLVYGQKNGKYAYVGMTNSNSKTTFTDTKALDADYNYYWVFPYITNIDDKMQAGPCEKYVYAKGVLPAVKNLKAASEKGGVKLTWGRVSGAEGYLVYGRRAGGNYEYIGMTRNDKYTDKKASKTEYNYYWVYPYHTNVQGKMIAGATPKYTYGRAR